MSTIGIPSAATAAPSPSAAPTVIPCSSATCPACWITGPSASGSENGMPISRAAMPEPTSFFPTSRERFRFGWPAIMYATSFRWPCARSASSSLDASESIYGVHVLVAASRKTDKDATARAEVARDHARLMKRMRRFKRRHDAFESGTQFERGHGVLVADGDVLDALDIAQERVLGPDARVVETGGDRMRRMNLTVSVLKQVRIAAVQHAGAAGNKRGRMLAALDPGSRGFDADQRHVLVIKKRCEDADGVGTAADTGHHHIGQLAVDGQVLLARLVTDDAL